MLANVLGLATAKTYAQNVSFLSTGFPHVLSAVKSMLLWVYERRERLSTTITTTTLVC